MKKTVKGQSKTDKLIILIGKVFRKWKLSKNLPKVIFGKSYKIELEDISSYLEILNRYHPNLGESCIRETPVKSTNEFDIQIIVPIYNVEKFLVKCLDSILNQKTEAKFIVTAVNDGSTDQSASILNTYENNPKIEIIHQKNTGLSGARNKALENIKAKYVMFVDSDDFIPEGTLQSLYEKSKQCASEIIGGGFRYVDSDYNEMKVKFPNKGASFGYAWGKLYRAEIFEKIKFPEKYIFEDTINNLIISPSAKNIDNINSIVYNYYKNTKSISRSVSKNPKILDTIYVTLQLMKDRKTLRLSDNLNFYNRLLNQFFCNQNRIFLLKDSNIDTIHFLLCCKVIEEYMEFTTNNKRFKLLEWSLKNKNFKAFIFACS